MNEETIKEVEALLMTVVGERGDNEGAVDVVKRLITESRDTITPERRVLLAEEIRSWKEEVLDLDSNEYNLGLCDGLEKAAEYVWQGVLPWKIKTCPHEFCENGVLTSIYRGTMHRFDMGAPCPFCQ